MAKKPTCEELEQRVKQSEVISFDSSTLLIYFSQQCNLDGFVKSRKTPSPWMGEGLPC